MPASKNISPLMFSETVERLRSQAGLQQERLAEIAGVSQGAVSGWKNGAIPKADVLYRLAGALGVSMEYLLTGEEPGDRPTMLPAPNVEVAEVRKRVKAAQAALAMAADELKKISP
jgi:transcriptional regulator with XRE-family HTH domain